MQAKPAASSKNSSLMPTLGEQFDPRQPLKQLAGRLIRELERNLPAAAGAEQCGNFTLYRRALPQ
ncbi:MAG: hypothetical protein WCH99_05650 [Verrucomicrobiota bacterium]